MLVITCIKHEYFSLHLSRFFLFFLSPPKYDEKVQIQDFMKRLSDKQQERVHPSTTFNKTVFYISISIFIIQQIKHNNKFIINYHQTEIKKYSSSSYTKKYKTDLLLYKKCRIKKNKEVIIKVTMRHKNCAVEFQRKFTITTT